MKWNPFAFIRILFRSTRCVEPKSVHSVVYMVVQHRTHIIETLNAFIVLLLHLNTSVFVYYDLCRLWIPPIVPSKRHVHN